MVRSVQRTSDISSRTLVDGSNFRVSKNGERCIGDYQHQPATAAISDYQFSDYERQLCKRHSRIETSEPMRSGDAINDHSAKCERCSVTERPISPTCSMLQVRATTQRRNIRPLHSNMALDKPSECGTHSASFQWPPFSGPPVGPANFAILVFSATLFIPDANVAWISPHVRHTARQNAQRSFIKIKRHPRSTQMKRKEFFSQFANFPIQVPQPVGSSQLSTDSTIGKPRFVEHSSIAARNFIQDVLICLYERPLQPSVPSQHCSFSVGAPTRDELSCVASVPGHHVGSAEAGECRSRERHARATRSSVLSASFAGRFARLAVRFVTRCACSARK